ncbi:hypothetical protein HAV1_gp25 [Hyperthermophilic Archaeal Virus 1]|uniref:hypothetical protein n=1 Tax=Hyperthermophilic Archaeal Virus 1 TaxID=762905 RepID=UPI0001DBAE04|nr:hypothetical protein HAV1_gp25 [Hyperthermophilic Archaeal Virus 1]ADJ54248.1 hypothetical protein HAV1_gp25 [Hyperthermophilic Archaeal Virus 1]
MSSEEKKIRVKKLRIVADQLVIEPSRIIIKRPGKEKERKEEEELLGFEEEEFSEE